ncbi:MAG: glycosyltransferase family 2 protein [Actinomycetaceae bacterium]|nr:glycosyltransferase family 2 protein [Actinomycetaceae bacterium]MDO5747032.1 glycosyltransferase family 2 protein [Actinomycetaceae bacterium]
MARDCSTVSIGIIALNEQEYLPNILADIAQQDYADQKIEVILVDSGSTDLTKQIMEDFAQNHPQFQRVKILDNPKKILPAGWNIFLDEARNDVLVRVDAHARIPTDFVSASMAEINKGHDAVGGVRPCVVPDNATDWNRILLAVEESIFGSSPAEYRGAKAKSGYVKSIFHGAYRKAIFDKVGRFNENLARTEDNDINYRIRKAGYKIYLSTSINSYQIIRPTLPSMLKQKYGNGYWIGRTLFIQPGCINSYHLAPLGFVVLLASTGLLAISRHRKTLPLKTLCFLYGSSDLVLSLDALRKSPRTPAALSLPVLFALMHIVYGVGTLRGITDHVVKKLRS